MVTMAMIETLLIASIRAFWTGLHRLSLRHIIAYVVSVTIQGIGCFFRGKGEVARSQTKDCRLLHDGTFEYGRLYDARSLIRHPRSIWND